MPSSTFFSNIFFLMGKQSRRNKPPKTTCAEAHGTVKLRNRGRGTSTACLEVDDGRPRTLYYEHAERLTHFKVSDLSEALCVPLIDMHKELEDRHTLFEAMSDACVEKPQRFRMYMRTCDNVQNFTLLQHCVEECWILRQLQELQGWILQYGALFIIGGTSFSLSDSVSQIKKSVASMVEHVQQENDHVLSETDLDDRFVAQF